MSKVDREVKNVVQSLMSFIVPPGMTARERNDLARRAGVSANTLRTNLRRGTINADTLFRLLIARGVLPKTLANLPQEDLAKVSRGETEWLALGRQLTETERTEFAGLVRFVRSRWNLK